MFPEKYSEYQTDLGTTALYHMKKEISLSLALNKNSLCHWDIHTSHQEPSAIGERSRTPSPFFISVHTQDWSCPPAGLWCWTRFIHRRFPLSNMFTYRIPDTNPSFIDSTSQMNLQKTTVSSCCLDGELNIKVKAISLCARGVARPWDMSLWSCDLTSPQNCNYHVICSSASRNRLGSWDYFWKQSPSC